MTASSASTPHLSARPALRALAAITLYWVAELLAQMTRHGPGGDISARGIQTAVAQSAVIVVALFLGLALVRRTDLTFRIITLVFLLGTLLNLIAWAWLSRYGAAASPAVWRGVQGLLVLPQLVLLVWVLRADPLRWLMSGLVMAGVFLGAQQLGLRYFPVGGLYYVHGPDNTPRIDIESLYAMQDRLMAGQIASVAPQRPGTPDVLGLFLAGTAHQSVFLNEIEAVAGILDDHFGTGDHSIRLANSTRHPDLYPLANRANLRRALTEIGQRQGPEDLAFLVLTSHGKEDYLALDFPAAGTSNLAAAEFATMLDESGIGAAVIVISACHSGSFIDDIAAPDRLIITAARADRTSFGCRDGAEWTDFGQSFFDSALRSEPDPRKAFAIAAKDVARKETVENLRQSQPQISEGAEIGAVLDRLLAARAALPVMD